MTGTNEQIEMQRYVDGVLIGAELAAFERRLMRDAALRAAVDEMRGLRETVAAAAAPAQRAPAGFRARVLDEVRRLPTRGELESTEPNRDRELAQVVALGRRLFVAAVLVCGLALLVWAGLLRRTDSARVEASDRKALLELQERIEQERDADRPEIRRR